jgi:hypothetical protein
MPMTNYAGPASILDCRLSHDLTPPVELLHRRESKTGRLHPTIEHLHNDARNSSRRADTGRKKIDCYCAARHYCATCENCGYLM